MNGKKNGNPNLLRGKKGNPKNGLKKGKKNS